LTVFVAQNHANTFIFVAHSNVRPQRHGEPGENQGASNMSRIKLLNVSRYITTMAKTMVALCGLFVATSALAQTAYLSHRTSLRAGPDARYPQVAWLGAGSTVHVHGCVHGYRWCDVSVNGIHGWANARHLQYGYQNRRVIVYGNGLAFGAPVVGFTVGSYWDNHYRDRPWYHHNGYWSGWRPGVAPRAEYYRAPSVYVAPRPAYVHPHRAEFHAQRAAINAQRAEQHAQRAQQNAQRAQARAQRDAQRREAQRILHERHPHINHNSGDRRSAPPAVMGFTR
jgi:uncharacterized protein YraI